MSGGVFGNAISTDIVSSDRDETAAIAGAIDCLLKADLRDFSYDSYLGKFCETIGFY